MFRQDSRSLHRLGSIYQSGDDARVGAPPSMPINQEIEEDMP